MIKIGDTQIQDIRLGTNKVKASIGNTPVMGYPYDHKILYLESENTYDLGNEHLQYIDLDIIPNENTGIYIKLKPSAGYDQYFIGIRDNSQNTRWLLGRDYDKGYYYGYNNFYYFTNNNQYSGITELKLNYLNNKKTSAIIDNNFYEYDLPSLEFIPQNNIRLFGGSGYNANYTKGICCIYECKITQGNKIVYDLIPVRKDGVGYMYDKVSNTLFGNDGTGDFILGPDI